MARKNDNRTLRRMNGSMATRLLLAAGFFLVVLADAAELPENNPYVEYDTFLRNYNKMFYRVYDKIDDNDEFFDVIGMYYTMALLALGSKGETQRELVDALYYCTEDQILSGAALLNKTIPTYSQFNFESYIMLDNETELTSEFDHKVTRYIPFVEEKTYNGTFCERDCTSVAESSQEVCFSSYSDYKADWAKPFDPKQTSKTKKEIMSRTGIALYKEDKDRFKMQMLTIPFATLDSVLILMKPNDGAYMNEFSRRVYSDFDDLVKNMVFQQAPTNVKLRLPKFNSTRIAYYLYTFNDRDMKIFGYHANTVILKGDMNSFIRNYQTNITIELNEKGINYKAKTVAGNVNCEGNPERKIPTLKKSSVQSPFAVPEFVSLVAGIANETLKPASKTVIDFGGHSSFLYFVLTTDLTVLFNGGYD